MVIQPILLDERIPSRRALPVDLCEDPRTAQRSAAVLEHLEGELLGDQIHLEIGVDSRREDLLKAADIIRKRLSQLFSHLPDDLFLTAPVSAEPEQIHLVEELLRLQLPVPRHPLSNIGAEDQDAFFFSVIHLSVHDALKDLIRRQRLIQYHTFSSHSPAFFITSDTDSMTAFSWVANRSLPKI